MLRNHKGQSLVEFALILPLLLLLLLGIVEAARTIWAFITVQQAAREAARFAVTGRPYLNVSGNPPTTAQGDVCEGLDPEPDPFVVNVGPWECQENHSIVLVANPSDPAKSIFWNPRVEAIKKVAIDTGRTLTVSDECDTPEEYYGACAEKPGAFGVLIQGQVTTTTLTGTVVIYPVPVVDHPGYQGLNIQVSTFYNLQMITPIFDALMGNQFIQLQGRVQLQNEGLDKAAGIESPPPLGAPPPPGNNPPDPGTFNEQISAQNSPLLQSQSLTVDLFDHDSSTPYDVLLEKDGTIYQICAGLHTSPATSNLTNQNCSLVTAMVWQPLPAPGSYVPISGPMLPGNYALYSALGGTTTPKVATWGSLVEILSGGDPTIAVEGKVPPQSIVWATNEEVDVTLNLHDPAFNYDVKLFDPNGNSWVIDTNHDPALPISNWKVPDVGAGVCGVIGNNKCWINSFETGGSTPVATTSLRINNPLIVMDPPNDTDPANGIAYVRGEHVNLYVRTHTPFKSYNFEIPSGTATNLTTVDANQNGDTFLPVVWVIPDDCGSGTGFPNGNYTLSSHSIEGSLPLIATKDFEVYTPPEPDLLIDGNDTRPAGTTIKLRLLRHAGNTNHYLEFDGVRITTGNAENTITTDDCGRATLDFTIPPTTIAGQYVIKSFNANNNTEQDFVVINVLAKPFIYVLEGDVVPPDQTITIRGTSHVPNDPYAIFYANKFLQGVLAEADGTFQFTYDLKNLPTTPPPDLSDSSNLGIPYILDSQTVVAPITQVASTTLTILGADLVVTKINVAPVAPLSTTVPVDIVVQNMFPVTINGFVDVDFYDLQIPTPDPFGPSYLAGYNFPGDVKFWKNTVGPSEVFTFSYQLPVEKLGENSLYGYADVSNNVFENEQSGEVANPNNINSAPLLANCPTTLTTDTFDNAALPGWASKVYGNGGVGSLATVAGGSLSLNSSGLSTWIANDDTDGGGQLLLHQNGTFSTTFGLDVQVMLSHVDLTADGTWSKAGLEIRDSLDPASPRVTWGVARNDGAPVAGPAPRQVMQAGARDTGSTMTWVGGQNYWQSNHKIDLDLPTPVPVWLRITRDPGTNGAFNFYYKQSATPPPALNDDAAQLTYWQGTLAESVTVSGIGESVVVGLFNASYKTSTAGTSKFDNFSIAVADAAACSVASQQDGPPAFPPLYEVCTPVLVNTSFEAAPVTAQWKFPPSFTDVSQKPGLVDSEQPGGHFGDWWLSAMTYDASVVKTHTPHFHQKFTMPDWVIATTTSFNLDLYRKVDVQGSSQPADKFYVIVVTSPTDPFGTSLTLPQEVANGGAVSGWNKSNLASLPLKPGVNLENYKNQNLYLYFYNNSNDSSVNACAGGCKTTFGFDDINLNVCTKEPPPSSVTTRIKGQLTLNFSNGTSEALPFVKVWAYAQGVSPGVAPVYETFTIQNGEFNFYNLPTGTYTIYAQYNLVQGNQIETLSDDATVQLTSLNTDSSPAQVFLSLFTLGPLP